MNIIFVQFEQNNSINFNDLHKIDLQVDVLTIDCNHLSMLPVDVIDRLIQKINKKLELISTFLPNDRTTYNEKLAYLRRNARSRGKPVC